MAVTPDDAAATGTADPTTPDPPARDPADDGARPEGPARDDSARGDSDHYGSTPDDSLPHDSAGGDSAAREPTAGRPATRGAPPVPAPRRRAATPAGRPRRAPLALAAAVTTGWAAVVSLTPVLVVVLLAYVASGAHAPVDRVVRVGFAGWLLAHGVQLHTGLGPIGFAPLAIAVLAAWRVVRAGVHTTRAIGGRRTGSPRLALLAAGAVALAYGLLGAAVALLTKSPGLSVPAGRAGLTLAAFGAVAALAGALRETGLYARLARRTPLPARDAVRSGLVAALLVLGAGAAAAGMAVALSGGKASGILAAYHTGVAGQAGLTVLCLVYAPNFAVWAASYLVGPGFAVGAGTTVSAAGVSLGAVPALPVLAAIPTHPASGWGRLLLAVPLAAGMAAGWLLARRRIREARGVAAPDRPAEVDWVRLLGPAALAGPVAGLALAVAAFASGGALGAGRLAVLGPGAWPLGAIAAGLVSVGALVAAAATRGFTVNRSDTADD